MVSTGGNAFTLVHEHKNGWNPEAFKERYSEVLDRYDYIVGDWGYSQLRLRGFYKDGHPRATKETTISSLVDYLNEYCNFGCAYFVLTRADVDALPPGTPIIDLGLSVQSPESAAESAASSEAAAQTTAETAAAATGGMLMRWPLKERPGGPVRVPGAAAVARAAQEAERRNQQAQSAAAGKTGGDARSSRQGDGGFGRQGSRPYGGGADKRSGGGQAAAAEGRSGGRPQGQRGPRPQGGERPAAGGSIRPAEPVRSAERPEGAKNGGRWPGKNRRRNRFGGKPNRPEGGPREAGNRPDFHNRGNE
ncbi:DUF1027 domain-containing protein [Cohnella pontilimi]|uniref:DUF1027 domain-containing protein n=1 Tax=Cohnella pontilimi TaxID=2564100 RepID=A0A4U0F5K3_9BACL|nr:DUF1027 domain-containing protein [Cohnella pontilimi]